MEIQLAQNYCPHVLQQANISPKRLDKAIETIKELFGDEWLESLIERYIGDEAYKMFKHPIYDGLLRGEVSMATPVVVELSSCLEALRDKNSFAAIVRELKDPDGFLEYFYQLSTAYRLSYLDPDVQMEPLINGKTPDNAFSFESLDCVVECTVMSGSSTYVRFQDAMQQLGSHTFACAEKHGFSCNVLFEATHESSASDSKIQAMESEIERLISLKKIGEKGGTDCCNLSIHSPDHRPEGVLGMMQTWMDDMNAVRELSVTGKTSGKQEYKSGFFVDDKPIAESLRKELEERIYDKIAKKRAQVAPLRDDYKIFLFIDTDVSWRQLMGKRDEVGDEIAQNFLTQDDDLYSMIVLTSRPRDSFSLFGINRSIHARTDFGREWVDKFWKGYMQPTVDHNFFLKTTGRNDPCPCGIGFKYKQCHGYYF
ncbi:hypothetical protein CL635_00185 [bacterium]|nr:hypothetical protein [bacterium]|tara:strand:- start:23200 stop:24477 length:1278 start_codon:yes stop_codon:yes gene_type:complete